MRRKARQPTASYRRAFVRHHGATVLTGPFAGMIYTRRGLALAEDVVAKLAGAYELELHDVMEEAIRWEPEVIANIGSGEGYYAVGLARRCPDAVVVAYDIDELRQQWSAKMAGANNVTPRFTIRGACDPGALEADLAGRRAFVLCDCEGGEDGVLQPELTPSLARALVVVEFHDFVVPGVSDRVAERFAATHDLEWIDARQRFRDDFPTLQEVDGSDYMDHDLALLEFRPAPMRWLVARPR